MNLESQKVSVNKSVQDVFDWLCIVENFEQLMPENIMKFQILDENTFVFGLKGMPEIELTIKEKKVPNQLVLGATSDKLPFILTISIAAVSENCSDVKLDFEGNFNPMMTMMIKGPIQKFIDTLVHNMNKL